MKKSVRKVSLIVSAAVSVCLFCLGLSFVFAKADPMPPAVLGDTNGDGAVNSDDVLHLLYSFAYPDDYEAEGDYDFNFDTDTDVADAVYLLFHVFFPQSYPIKWNYPMSAVTADPGTIVTNQSSASYNKYITATGYQGAMISLENYDFDRVTIIKRAGAAGSSYAFFAIKPVLNAIPTYATGYTAVVTDTRYEFTVKIPENARYLYIYHHSNNTMFLPEAIRFFHSHEEPEADENSFTLATWNIGHFSGGANKNSSIKESEYAEKKAQFRDFIYQGAAADVFALNEYSAKFTTSPARYARNELFQDYTTRYEGKQSNYSCNAVYSDLDIRNITTHDYVCNQSATITHTTAIKASDYYYITADISIGGKMVKLVSTHLAFDTNKNPDTINQDQIRELIDLFRNEERVILLGDWNVRAFSYFNLFTAAGFSLANTNEKVYTYSASSLDNIVYKGVEISDFTLLGTNLSDHNAIKCRVTVR